MISDFYIQTQGYVFNFESLKNVCFRAPVFKLITGLFESLCERKKV